MTIDADILIVVATVVSIFAFSSTVAGWVNRNWPWVAMTSLAIGIGLLVYVHLGVMADGLSFWDVPNAFVNVAAMVLN